MTLLLKTFANKYCKPSLCVSLLKLITPNLMQSLPSIIIFSTVGICFLRKIKISPHSQSLLSAPLVEEWGDHTSVKDWRRHLYGLDRSFVVDKVYLYMFWIAAIKSCYSTQSYQKTHLRKMKTNYSGLILVLLPLVLQFPPSYARGYLGLR